MKNIISNASVLLLLSYAQISESLSKISIALKPYQYQYVDPNYNYPKASETPVASPENEIPAFRTFELPKEPNEPEGSINFRTLNNIENTATIIPASVKPIIPKKRKTKRKPRRKPKKMHLRRVFKTRLITTTPRPVSINEIRIEEETMETTTNVINLAPIFDAQTGTSYTAAELNRICSETVNVSKGFGISDIESFAKNNCFLIRLYYPDVTCSQINQLVGYCKENGLING